MNTETASPRILIVGIDWLGDVLFSTPLIRALRGAHPDAYLAYSTASRCVDVLRNNPHLDSVIAYDERPFLLNVPANVRFWHNVRKGRFDQAFFLHRSLTRAFLVAAAGVPERIGYDYAKRNRLITQRVRHPGDAVHRAEIYMKILQNQMTPVNGMKTEFFLGETEHRRWNDIRKVSGLGDRPYAVLHPGGNWDLKRWPLVHFEPVAEYLISRGMDIAVSGSVSEEPLANSLKLRYPAGRLFSFCGKTDIGSLGAMIEGARVMISNDSGPSHLAAALGTPLAVLFGPTLPQSTGPLGKGPIRVVKEETDCALPCYKETCDSHRCMKLLRPERVIAAVEELLGKE